MQLLSNWKEVLKRAWSVKWWAAAIFFTGLEVALPAIQPFFSVPDKVFAAIGGVAGSIGILARLLAQKPKVEEEANGEQA